MASQSGTIIYNQPLKLHDLPPHHALSEEMSNGSSMRPALAVFVRETLLEGNKFMDTVKWAGSNKAKASQPSTARVEIGKRDIDVSTGPEKVSFEHSILPSRQTNPPRGNQHFYGRKSQHENASKDGTASFAELDDSLRKDHSPKEADYTPDIFACLTILDYAADLESINIGHGIEKADLKVYEMAHNLGGMLSPRVFAVAVVSGQMDHGTRFVVVQLPIDLSKLEGAYYSNGRNTKEGVAKLHRKRCVQGFYASIERGVHLGEKTEWTMVTSSDAGGNLPKWLQDMVAPGKVVHDVGLVMKWLAKKRSEAPAPVPAVAVTAPVLEVTEHAPALTAHEVDAAAPTA